MRGGASVAQRGKNQEEFFAPDYFDYLVIDEFHHAVNEQYENGQGSTDLKRTGYLKMDYIRLKVLGTFVSVTVAAFLVIVLIVMYRAEYVLENAASLPLGTLSALVIAGSLE